MQSEEAHTLCLCIYKITIWNLYDLTHSVFRFKNRSYIFYTQKLTISTISIYVCVVSHLLCNSLPKLNEQTQ